MRGMLAYFVRHRTAANLILVIMIALGLAAATQLRAQFFPDVVVENVRVSVAWDGAGPDDMDRGVVSVLEPAVAAVEGVEGTLSTSREGSASIRIDFEPGWDMARAAGDVETAVGQVLNSLPDGADDPVITRGAWRDRVTEVVISGPVGVEQLSSYGDEFLARLFREGVTRTSMSGVEGRSILVTATEASLIRHDVTLRQIANAIGAGAETRPAGDVGSGARLRTGVEKRTAEEIAAIVVRSDAQGRTLTVGEVAEVREEGITRNRAYFRGDFPAVQINVDRSAAGDAIGIQNTVEQIATEMEATLPEGVTIELIRTRAEAISDRLNILLSNGLMGLALVVGLLFLFLSARTAFWVAAGIPVAMLATLALMFAFGLTLNMISLFALLICLGIVVDDAIVVGEHADYRHRELGESPVLAATNAAERMSLPVVSATITTVIAFAGLAVISGRFGQLIADIPFTVSVVLLASLIECFLILPAHMRHALEAQERAARGHVLSLFAGLALIPVAIGLAVAGLAGLQPRFEGDWALIGEAWEVFPMLTVGYAFPGWSLPLGATLVSALGLLVLVILSGRVRATLAGPWYDAPSRVVNRGFEALRRRVFRPFIALVIRARYPVLALSFVALAGAISLFQQGDVTWRFFNNPEENSVSGNIAMLPGTPREETRAMVRELDRATNAVGARFAQETGVNPIVFVMTQVGGTTGRGLSGADQKEPDELGSITIELLDADLRPMSSRDVVSAIQDEVRRAPNLETFSFRRWGGGPGGDNLDVKFYGSDIGTLKAASQALISRMGQFGEVSGLEDTLPYDKSELALELTPRGAALGFTIDGVGTTLRDRLAGIEAARFPEGTRNATVTVRLDPTELTADFLDKTHVTGPDGAFVRLSEVVSVRESLGFASIRREDGLRVVTVTGEISEDDPARADEISTLMRSEILPDIASRYGVEYVEGGLAQQERDFLSEAMIGFALCLLGIYLTLAWIFSSWLRPIVVMAIIPFGLVGTIWGHYIWDVPLSMFTVVGLIGMTGIIINDSIVLITRMDERAKGRAIVPAVIDAVSDRLRAVLLTTLTTVLGLAPLLYETSQQAQFLKPTVITLVYGLGFGMVLVLVIVPSLVIVQRDVGLALRGLRRMGRGTHVPARARWIMGLTGVGMVAVIAATVGAYGLTGAMPFGFGLPGAMGALVAMGLGLIGVFTLAVLMGWISSRSVRRRAPA
ncbi:multidrug efflux pump subunit AcrB [Rubricella aquisinus]|uniref:Multidrug efflux pump subunit AcrB n=1 Tax=Rubricella aquisinus TaxID=2028108 RepID=A0A840WXM0_9RHOB|nr:efflux RND transporter permease subunit [Rubricella aquisinus]MBB5514426.1 multidrug efflux pump subunit AcrB [Rubricella aquisinus]